MGQINLLLLCGGGGDEHAISLLSADFLEASLAKLASVNLLRVELDAKGQFVTKLGQRCELTSQKKIRFEDETIAPWPVNYAIPCIHGYPGESGDIQSYFKLINLPYFGCDAESSSNCFNKVTAKMWFSALGIPNTPYLFLNQLDDTAIAQAKNALDKWGSIFVKAASQGSSVGCYRVDDHSQIDEILTKAFGYSPYVIIEKTIKARELEVAVYQYNDQTIATLPGEIICSKDNFYSFDEKYASNSQATTKVVADLPDDIAQKIRQYACRAFDGMKLAHMARIDFFLTHDNEILLNEINTFPGLTPISMFPKMLINHGDDFGEYLAQAIDKAIK